MLGSVGPDRGPQHEATEGTQQALLQAILRGTPLRQTLERLIAALEHACPEVMASVLLVEDNRLRLAAGPSLPDGYNRAMDRVPIGEGFASSGTAAHRGEPVMVADIQADALWTNYREIAARYGLAGCCAFPLPSPTNQVLGTFTIYHREPRLPRPDELRLVFSCAELAAVAVEYERMRDALADSDRRFRELVDDLEAMVWDTSSDARRFSCVSGHAQQVLGVPFERWKAEPRLWQELIHPDDRADVVARQRDALGRSDELRYEREYRLQGADGRTSWVRDKVSSRMDGTDGTRRLRGVTIDVTAQRQAEHDREEMVGRLANERSLLRSVVEQLPEAVTIISAQGEMLLANRAAEQTMNMKLDAPGRVQESYADFQVFSPDGRRLAIEEWPVSRALATGETIRDVVMEYVAADGARRSLNVNSAPIRDERERIIAVVSIFADITDQRRDDRLRELLVDAGALMVGSRDELATARAVAALAVERFADWLLVVTRGEGRELRCVAAEHRDPEKRGDLEALRGLLAQPGGLPFRIGTVMASGRSAVMTGLDAEDFEAGPARGEALRLVRALGAASAITVPLTTPAGVVGAMAFVWAHPRSSRPAHAGFAEELARRVALSLENARLFDDAQRAVRHREEFLSIAAHELKTPLASLHVTIQDLKERLAEPDPDLPYLRERVAAGERSTSRLDRLMKELLDVAVIQLGRLRLVREEVDLLVVVRSALSYLSSELRSKGIDVAVHALAPVLGCWDAARLEQVVANLISNAIKYGKGGPIAVLIEATEDVATLQVEDRGMGIAPEIIPRLFKPFERGVAAGHFGGLGLGLHISQQIIRAHGGEIHVRSRVSKGSTFTIDLPRKEPS
jgi:PAS domain S-box-containing protein